ncbi:Fe-S cluster assembly protein SufD [Puniceicoccaceae bacterium K14]|nr:Fe-S cluster assembly protein SufD [Puniceicoccaceae bacterium K14]
MNSLTEEISVDSETDALAAVKSDFQEYLDILDTAPSWWKDIKKSAFEDYCALPDPSRKDETWRFANLKAWRGTNPEFSAMPSISNAQSLIERSDLIKTYSGQIVIADNQTIQAESISPELSAKGVVFTTLKKALSTHGALIKDYFMKQEVDLGSAKAAKLHTAFLENGVILFVPKGVEVEDPFIVYNWATSATVPSLPHTLVIAEDLAKVSLIEAQLSADESTPSYSCGVGHIFAGASSKVQLTVLQNFNEQSVGTQISSNITGKDALVKTLSVNVGCKQYRSETHGKIVGSGAHVEMLSLAVTDNDQEIDQRTLQTHDAPHATSDLLFKNALRDKSKTIFSGLIKVAEHAQQTDAYQTNRNLLLSSDAEANSLPGLEIEANDVKCSHGATTSQIEPEEIFYMLARGIDRDAANELIVNGFFEEVLERIDVEELAENVRQLIRSKFKK